MVKRIICSVLAALMLIGTVPLSVLAEGVSALADGIQELSTDTSLPTVNVSSRYNYDEDDDLGNRALPDEMGMFYFDISLSKSPEVDGDILVYYRTIDDTAVSKWGDYEAVGKLGDAYVTLNKDNGYKARVAIESQILGDAFRGPSSTRLGVNETGRVPNEKIYSRRFYFELTSVVGGANLSSETEEKKLACYLRAQRYHYLYKEGESAIKPFKEYWGIIDTPTVGGNSSYSANLNIGFDDTWQDLVASGHYNLGVSVYGDCYENFWNSDGPATLHLYYTYNGVKRPALSLYLEGEWDDSTFFGWELAYDYIDNNFYDERVEDVDIEDFIEDNFIGFTLYDNNGNVSFEAKLSGNDRGNIALSKLLDKVREARINKYAVEAENDSDGWIKYEVDYLHYLKLPSNFVLADSYSYKFESSTDEDPRWLENVTLAFTLIGKEQPKIEEDDRGVQYVTTNFDDMMAGDPLRVTVRFSQPLYLRYNTGCYITANINGTYPVKLTAVNKLACDTLVFEGTLPDGMENVGINSLKDITLKEGGFSYLKAFLTNWAPLSKRIDDIYGIEADLRAPYATVNSDNTDSWLKSKPIDLYVFAKDTSARFDDYVMVYYQWSNDKSLPQSYDSRVPFYTSSDGEVMKTIIGTGNGEMYLHIKAVSRYGQWSISDSLTETYDPDDPSATYTPFGPYKFDNAPPAFTTDDFEVSGDLKNQILTVNKPDDGVGIGLQYISLYYVPRDAEGDEGVLLKKFEASEFTSGTVQHEISHSTVGVGVDENGAVFAEREQIEFYWIVADRIGNVSDRIASFSLTFDTNDYLEGEIIGDGPRNFSEAAEDESFVSTSEKIDRLTYIYNYALNEGKNVGVHTETGRNVAYGFFFKIDHAAFGETDLGTYGALVDYKGAPFDSFTVEYIEEEDVYVVWLLDEIASGRYDIRLTRTEGDSVRISKIYSIYATNGERDETEVKNRVELGTLLNNEVFQLSSDYPYFYYKDSTGTVCREEYNGTKPPPSFSSYSKAKEYVYFMELSDISLIQLNSALATALNSGTTGYIKAKGEITTAMAGQYWIRYKSESWTPSSGESSWVYYYYGMSPELTRGALSMNLQNAINAVSNRLVGYGKNVILTDTSLFLGSTMGDKMLNEYGMPYLLDGQIHDEDETATHTKCGNEWEQPVYYTADKNIYKSNVFVGEEGSEGYAEYPIVGFFRLPANSIFQYMTYEEYNNGADWRALEMKSGESFVNVIKTSGVYYIREMSGNGVSVFAIYVDKEAPMVNFFRTDEDGNSEQIPVDGVDILDIRAREIIIGRFDDAEYDRLSYVAVYKVSNLSLVGIYSAQMLDSESVKLEDGNYYIVVSDRSGNHYTITAKVSGTPLECQIKETEDKFIRLTCNRRGDQILRYEVYLNGELITSTYAAEATFDRAGLYTINIQDIYGNIFAQEYQFERNYPTVNWKYLGDDGKYHTYDPDATDTEGFVMSRVSENKYKISTAVKTRFSFSENYGYEFVGVVPEHSENIGVETVVTISEGQSFSLKVYYKNYPDNYTVYSGLVDVTPPTISASAEIDIPINAETGLVDQWLANNEAGEIIHLEELYYMVKEKSYRTFTSGSTISSDIIKINANDVNGLSSVEVYVDGSLSKRQDVTTGFSQIILSRWGSYRIIAIDSLGNVAEFNFVNGKTEHFDYLVDGVEREVDLHCHLNFETVDGKTVYTKVDYGRESFKLDLKRNADVFVSVGVSDEDPVIYGFRLLDGRLYPLFYAVELDEDGNKVVDIKTSEAIIDPLSDGFLADTDYRINNEDGPHAIYASVSSDGVLSINAYAPEDESETVLIGARLQFEGNDTKFVCAELHVGGSDILLRDPDGGVIDTSDSDIRIGDGFTIDSDAFADERIFEVHLYYSRLNDLVEGSISGRTDIYSQGAVYDEDGFYLLTVKNLYGNETSYRISISKSFGVTSSVTFGDGHKIYYGKEYENILYSNYEITLDVLNDDVTYEVTLNGAPYDGFSRRTEDGIIYLTFTQSGTYEVYLRDSYGNAISRRLEISTETCNLNEDLLTGYNEKALKRDEGYTNRKLSIDKNVFDSEGLYYLAIIYGGETTVLFDAFVEDPIFTDPEKLVEIVGASGDGLYTVVCRNRYGAMVSKEVHYRSTPTLKLERTTRSEARPRVYSIEQALSVGFWSNNSLIFNTEALTYVFTINGDVTECPRTLSFDGATELGSSEYEITYIDEYGFEYSFKAHLLRKNVSASVSDGISGVDIDGILNTQSDISIVFEEKDFATYTLNNGAPVAYDRGDVLKKDGVYRFTVFDYAGNVTMLTVKKDTMVEFSFVEANTMTQIQNGGVVNSSKVNFDIFNGDSAYIEKVLLDGVLQEDFNSTRFTEDGKWEVIVSDRLGNKAYFCFYIITHSKNGFTYTTPYEYRINELWYNSGDGVKISYMNLVSHGDFSSSFKLTDNGNYSVVMSSVISGRTLEFNFTVNTTPPSVSLVNCNDGETTLNDVSVAGCKVGDVLRIYKATATGETLIHEVEVTSASTIIPTISEGGEYRVVVESEAGVTTELSFVRRHVMNTSGSIFIMIIIAVSVVGLFAGLVYRNKSKTDD